MNTKSHIFGYLFGHKIINFFAKSFVVFKETTIFVASIYKGGTQPT